MKYIFIIQLAVALAIQCFGSETNQTLELTSDFRTLRLGQYGFLELSIHGIDDIVAIEDSDPSQFDTRFIAKIFFKPTREGEYSIGPYEFTFNERRLKSNEINVFVLPEWDGNLGTFFRVDKNSISLGEDVELVMEQWSDTIGHNDLRLKFNDPSFRLRHHGSSSGGSAHTDETTGKKYQIYHFRTTWRIAPKEQGAFVINKQIFEQFPEGMESPDISITAK